MIAALDTTVWPRPQRKQPALLVLTTLTQAKSPSPTVWRAPQESIVGPPVLLNPPETVRLDTSVRRALFFEMGWMLLVTMECVPSITTARQEQVFPFLVEMACTATEAPASLNFQSACPALVVHTVKQETLKAQANSLQVLAKKGTFVRVAAKHQLPPLITALKARSAQLGRALRLPAPPVVSNPARSKRTASPVLRVTTVLKVPLSLWGVQSLATTVPRGPLPRKSLSAPLEPTAKELLGALTAPFS